MACGCDAFSFVCLISRSSRLWQSKAACRYTASMLPNAMLCIERASGSIVFHMFVNGTHSAVAHSSETWSACTACACQFILDFGNFGTMPDIASAVTSSSFVPWGAELREVSPATPRSLLLASTFRQALVCQLNYFI
jgi:hypothetical protein